MFQDKCQITQKLAHFGTKSPMTDMRLSITCPGLLKSFYGNTMMLFLYSIAPEFMPISPWKSKATWFEDGVGGEPTSISSSNYIHFNLNTFLAIGSSSGLGPSLHTKRCLLRHPAILVIRADAMQYFAIVLNRIGGTQNIQYMIVPILIYRISARNSYSKPK